MPPIVFRQKVLMALPPLELFSQERAALLPGGPFSFHEPSLLRDIFPKCPRGNLCVRYNAFAAVQIVGEDELLTPSIAAQAHLSLFRVRFFLIEIDSVGDNAGSDENGNKR